MKTFNTFMLVAAALCAFAEGQPFDRYQTIIDRKPFGPEPVNFDPEAMPGSAAANAAAANGGEMTPEQRTAEEQQLAASVRVSVLNVTPAGVVTVGFTDASANPEEHYYLAVGRSHNGWTVKAADPSSESVTLEKGGVEVTVKLGEATSGGGKSAKGGTASRRTPFKVGVPLMGADRQDRGAVAPPPGAGPAPMLGGLARLRQRRMEQREKEQEDAAKAAAADAEAKAERAEREAREAEEKQRAAEERAQQREALLQIQEQLKRAREEKEAARRAQEEQGEANDVE